MMNKNMPGDSRPEARRRIAAGSRVSIPVAACAGLLCMTLGATAFADSMRCGTRVISDGDHAAKVVRYCGEPDFAHSRRAHVPFFNNVAGTTFYPPGIAEIWIEEWTYNLGPHKLMRLVTLENGIVRDIKHLGYGYSRRRD